MIDISKDLEEKIGILNYKRYFKNVTFKNKKNLITLKIENKIISNWIKTKYIDIIKSICEKKFNENVEIIIEGKEPSIREERKTIRSTQKQSAFLNPFFTFESFIVGPSNQFAFTAVKSVSSKPAATYNPIFIYGPTGLGKTHLVQAIGNEALKNGKSVIYVTIEQFVNDFTYHLKNQNMENFRKKYRKCDYLLIDDVQFLSDKIQTQEEFFHTFNELHQNGKQIILTSDKPPKTIAGLESRLKSRFEWGLIADISIPGIETKIAIIKKKCELNGIELNNEIIEYIASHMGENIREIESAITNINAYASLMRQKIDLEFAKNIIKDQITQEKKEINLTTIIKVISKELNIKQSEIKSKQRTKKIVEARRIAIYLARMLTPNSTPNLASYFGMKDHTAISHNMKKIEELLNSDEKFKIKVEDIKSSVINCENCEN